MKVVRRLSLRSAFIFTFVSVVLVSGQTGGERTAVDWLSPLLPAGNQHLTSSEREHGEKYVTVSDTQYQIDVSNEKCNCNGEDEENNCRATLNTPHCCFEANVVLLLLYIYFLSSVTFIRRRLVQLEKHLRLKKIKHRLGF